MKPGLISVIVFGFLSWLVLATYGCSGLQMAGGDQNVATSPAQHEAETKNTTDKGQAEIVEPKASQGFTVTFPNWPFLAYTTTAGDVIVGLSVKDPKSFPVPKEFVFTMSDGNQVKATIIRAPKATAP